MKLRRPLYFVKEIWGPSAGLTIFTFGVLWLILAIIKYKKIEKAKPNNMLYTFYFAWMFIFTVSALLYSIVLIQNFLRNSGVLPSKYVFENMDDLHLVFIMFIFIFGILSLVFKWRSNAKERKLNSSIK